MRRAVPMQWATDDANFRPVGIQKRLRQIPAGVYGMRSDMGGWFLRPAEVVMDKLIEVPSEPINRVMCRVQRFRNEKESYRRLGVIHKTGILMYGPPGCGKTAVLRALGGQFVADGAIVVQAPPQSGFTATVLQGIRNIEPDRLIVVEMEDIDSIAEYDEEDLLALLDGAQQIEGVVYLATTNKITELPDRIKNRPSRIDDRVYVGPPDVACRTKYLLAKWRGDKDEMVAYVAQRTDGFSYAHLKEVVVSVECYGLSPDESIGRLRLTLDVPSEEDKKADDKWLAGVGVSAGASADGPLIDSMARQGSAA